MFSKPTDNDGRDRHNHSILQDGVTVKGEILANGDVRLDGTLDGKITATERVTIGATGVVKADVEAGEVVVMGSVEGKIRALRRLELRKGARMIGDVATPVLLIEEGVFFQGTSNMDPEALGNPSLGVLAGGKGGTKTEAVEAEALDASRSR